MRLKSKSLLARYYSWVLGSLPDDLCTYFWNSLWLVLFGVFVIPGRLWVGRYEPIWVYIGHGIGGLVILTMFLVATGRMFYPKGGDFLVWFLWGLLADLIIIGVVAVVGLIVVGAIALYRRPNPKFVENTKTILDTIRKKYCTKIDWL